MEPHEKATQDCLAMENNQQALNCLKRVVDEYKGSNECAPRLVLLVQDGCVPCKEETALHQESIDQGTVEKIKIDSPRGIAIAQRNDISLIPSLVLLDCNDNLIFPV